jgi:hypothetical protein
VQALLWACGAAGLPLLVSHMFLRREGIQNDIYKGTYEDEVPARSTRQGRSDLTLHPGACR